jgi:hypothetical protein
MTAVLADEHSPRAVLYSNVAAASMTIGRISIDRAPALRARRASEGP